MPVDKRFYNTAVIRIGPTGERSLLGPIKRRKVRSIAIAKRAENLPPDCYLKVWLCGDTESEDVYREQGWFPD